MKKQRLILIILLTALPILQATQGAIPGGIIAAFRSGDAVKISGYFGQTVELTLLEEEQIYSSTQAQIILKDFFQKNRPVSFEIIHEGGKDSSKYAIGILKTQSTSYRITFLLKTQGSDVYIHQLRIQYEN